MNGYIGIPEKVNENVRIQKIGMAEKVPWMVVYGLRAFHRNPGGKPDYRGRMCEELAGIDFNEEGEERRKASRV